MVSILIVGYIVIVFSVYIGLTFFSDEDSDIIVSSSLGWIVVLVILLYNGVLDSPEYLRNLTRKKD